MNPPDRSVAIHRVDYADPADGAALLTLLEAYARDPMGGGAPLDPQARAALLPALAGLPGAVSLIAADASRSWIGLANCFAAFSTFAARPVLNIHDLYVVPEWRGHGVLQALMHAIEVEARRRQCCKITLEVLEGNARAQAAYRRAGFGNDGRHPVLGGALFWQKALPG